MLHGKLRDILVQRGVNDVYDSKTKFMKEKETINLYFIRRTTIVCMFVPFSLSIFDLSTLFATAPKNQCLNLGVSVSYAGV